VLMENLNVQLVRPPVTIRMSARVWALGRVVHYYLLRLNHLEQIVHPSAK